MYNLLRWLFQDIMYFDLPSNLACALCKIKKQISVTVSYGISFLSIQMEFNLYPIILIEMELFIYLRIYFL